MGIKITLAQCVAQDADHLLIFCENFAKPCSHAARMEVRDAIARFGAQTRIDDLPLVCSKCGSPRPEVRPSQPRAPGDGRPKSPCG